VVKDQGERKLKGLENPESLYLVFPQSLSGRMNVLEEKAAREKKPTTISRHSELEIQTDLIWRLWDITLRLERICGSLEYPGETTLREPNVALFNIIKNHGGELADSTVVGLVEHQVTRIEVRIPLPRVLLRIETPLLTRVVGDGQYACRATYDAALQARRPADRPCGAHQRGHAATADPTCRVQGVKGALSWRCSRCDYCPRKLLRTSCPSRCR
jgi:hypothetical protein